MPPGVTWTLFLLALLAPAALSTGRKSYDGHKVLKVSPENEAAFQTLLEIQRDYAIDFWEEPTGVGNEVKFMVSPDDWLVIEGILQHAGIAYVTVVDDVQHNLSPSLREMDRKLHGSRSSSRGRGRRPSSGFDLDDFNTLTDIYAFMDSLAERCRSGFQCKVITIGRSYEGRSIKMFKITKSGADRKGFWIDGTIHAREWLSTATVVRIMNHLVTSTEDDVERLIEAYDWYVVPIVNPDGYSYTWTTERYWRKNRRPINKNCIGVDLNRNFDYQWGREGVSHSPCSQVYCGPSGGSEPETSAISSTLQLLGDDLSAMVTIHSYSRMWMFSWGNSVNYTYNGPKSCERAQDYDDLIAVANAAADAVQETYGTDWSRGSSCEVIYPTTGASDDYAKAVAGIKYAFGLELRGDDFVIHKSNIAASFREIWNGVVAMCDAIATREQQQQQQR